MTQQLKVTSLCLEAIKNNKNDEPDFYRGAEIQNILDKCYESSENGKWVDI